MVATFLIVRTGSRYRRSGQEMTGRIRKARTLPDGIVSMLSTDSPRCSFHPLPSATSDSIAIPARSLSFDICHGICAVKTHRKDFLALDRHGDQSVRLRLKFCGPQRCGSWPMRFFFRRPPHGLVLEFVAVPSADEDHARALLPDETMSRDARFCHKHADFPVSVKPRRAWSVLASGHIRTPDLDSARPVGLCAGAGFIIPIARDQPIARMIR